MSQDLTISRLQKKTRDLGEGGKSSQQHLEKFLMSNVPNFDAKLALLSNYFSLSIIFIILLIKRELNLVTVKKKLNN